jgi:PAS domain S-box-containing protein
MRSQETDLGPIPVIIEYLRTQVYGASIQEIAQALNLNRNLVSKYLSILHMQGRLYLRSYGNIKIYRLSDKMPYHCFSLLSEDLVMGIDRSMVIRSIQGNSEQFFRIKEDKLLGKYVLDVQDPVFFNPQFVQQIRSILDGTLSQHTLEEYAIRGISVRLKIIPCIFDDGSAGVGLLCSKLAYSKEKYQEYFRLLFNYSSILHEMQEFYIEFSPDWRVITVNTAFCEYCRRPQEAILGTGGIPLVSHEDMGIIKNSFSEETINVPPVHHVFRVVLDDGSIRWQEWFFYYHEFREAKIGYHGFGRDISDRKLKESQIEIYQTGVEKLLYEKTEELREMMGRLRREIDERRALEKELKQSEELYRNLTESTSDIVWEINKNGDFIFVNDRARSLLGYLPAELLGRNVMEFVPPEEFNEISDYFKALQDNSLQSYPIRIRIVKKDGTYAWIEITGVPNYTLEGGFQGFRGVAKDVTAKILAEFEQNQLLSIIESSPDLIAMADSEGNLIYMNKAGRRMLKIPDGSDITGLNNSSFYSQYSKEKVAGGRKVADENGSWIGDTMLQALDDHSIPVSQVILSHQVLPGQKKIYSSVARDITDRINIEQELTRAYDYNRTLIEVSPDPLVTIGPDGTIQDVNKATERATGFSRDLLIGTNFSTYFSEPAKADAGYHQVYSSGYVRDYPLEILHKDGTTTPVLYNAVLYRDKEGEVQGVFAAARDITDIKKYQSMLIQSLSFFLDIMDLVPHPVWRSGKDTKFEYVNKAWLDFTGRSMDEEIGSGWTSGIHPEDRDRSISDYFSAFDKQQPFCLNFRLLHKDGTYHQVSDFGSPLYDQEDRFVGYIGSCYDRKNISDQ